MNVSVDAHVLTLIVAPGEVVLVSARTLERLFLNQFCKKKIIGLINVSSRVYRVQMDSGFKKRLKKGFEFLPFFFTFRFNISFNLKFEL